MTVLRAQWRYPYLLNYTSDIVLFTHADGRIVDANDAAASAYGYLVEELRELTLADLTAGAGDSAAILDMLRPSADGRPFETLHVRRDSHRFPVLCRVHHIGTEDNDEYLVVVHNLTEEKRTTATSRLLHEIDQAILQSPHVESILQYVCDELVQVFDYPLMYIGLTEADHSVLIWAKAGPAAGYLTGLTLRSDDTPEGTGPVGRALRTGSRQLTIIADDPNMGHWRELAAAHGLRSILALPLVVQGSSLGVLAVYGSSPYSFDSSMISNLTSFADQIALSVVAANQQAEIHRLAFRDPLITDLPNRRILEARLEVAVATASKENSGALMALDIDNFKVVTSTVGRTAGDRYLQELAHVMGDAIRPGDLLVRLAEDEFAVLLDSISLHEAEQVAEQVRRAVSEYRFLDSGHALSLSVSIGLVPVDGSLPMEAVMNLADAGQGTAKELGKNRVVTLRSEGDKGVALAEASMWAARIKDGLVTGAFELHFQPVVRLDNRVADHYETLIRMRDTDGKLVPPGKFLPAAERFGLMPQIDRWVVQSAFNLLEQHPNLRLFVNLAGASLRDDSLLAWIEEYMQQGAIKPGRLTFEITETTAVGNLEDARRWMKRMGELGCRFALDDFGIGFSSFAYLRGLPAEYVKIDGSFVRSITAGETDRAMVQAMYQIAHTMGKEVIAEWVEGEEIASVLEEIGVEHGQGYHFGKPMSLQEILALAPATEEA